MRKRKKSKARILTEQEASSSPSSQNSEVVDSLTPLPKKKEKAKLIEQLFYLISAALVPCIPLYFLYNQNVDAGIVFSHCFIFGLALAVLSIIAYILISLILRKRAASLIVVAVAWAAFWYFKALHKLFQFISGGSMSVTAVVAFVIIIILTVALKYVKFNKIANNTIALILCLLFTFNFVPAAFSAIELIPVNEEKSYEIKSSFNVDPNLQQPNIYWLHMDGMIGFSTFEEYFDDPQTELKDTLNEYGFVINETAELGGGLSLTSIPALVSPTFFDSWLSAEYEEYADLTRNKRQASIRRASKKQGFDFLDDIYPKAELMKALSDAGYLVTGNQAASLSEVTDVRYYGKELIFYDNTRPNTEKSYAQFRDFQQLVVEASVLKTLEEPINTYLDEITPTRPVSKVGEVPKYNETINKYLPESSDSRGKLKTQLRAVKHATEMEKPSFIYLHDLITHCATYMDTVGRVFDLDENGDKIDLEAIGDDSIYNLKKYFPAHYKYGVKQLMAKVDVIIESDPDAIIVIQADHGIHGLGPTGTEYFDEATFEKQGYSVEDMQNLNKSVFSAVRVPEKYGKLTEPLDPVDITRYLVNHYVGEGNYDYLYYVE